MTAPHPDNLVDALQHLQALRDGAYRKGNQVTRTAKQQELRDYEHYLQQILSPDVLLSPIVSELMRKTAGKSDELTTARKHHYVQRRYLYRFRTADADDISHARVASFVKWSGNGPSRKVEAVANEEELYALPMAEKVARRVGGRQVLEWVLSRLEGKFDTAIEAALTLDRLSDEHKRTIARIVSMQVLRGPDFVAHLMTEQNLSRKDARVLFLKILFHFDAYKRDDYFMKQVWLRQTCSRGDLYTSDAPIVGITRRESPPMDASTGLPRGLQITYPLSPHVVLRILDRDEWPHVQACDDHTFELTAGETNWCNALQTCLSYSHVFGSSSSFSVANEILAARSRNPAAVVNDLLRDYVGSAVPQCPRD